MDQPRTYENYPCRIVLISSLSALAIYLISAYIISRLGLVWMGVYVLFVLGLEIRLLRSHCVHCYYYGRFCAFGRGKLSAMLFSEGDPASFVTGDMSWKDMVPDLLVSLLPLLTGIVLVIADFDWVLLAMILCLIFLSSAGNGYIRGCLACRFCRQRKLGCSADKLFNKQKAQQS